MHLTAVLQTAQLALLIALLMAFPYLHCYLTWDLLLLLALQHQLSIQHVL